MQVILGDEKNDDAGDDKNENEKEVACLKDPTPADTEICAGYD